MKLQSIVSKVIEDMSGRRKWLFAGVLLGLAVACSFLVFLRVGARLPKESWIGHSVGTPKSPATDSSEYRGAAGARRAVKGGLGGIDGAKSGGPEGGVVGGAMQYELKPRDLGERETRKDALAMLLRNDAHAIGGLYGVPQPNGRKAKHVLNRPHRVLPTEPHGIILGAGVPEKINILGRPASPSQAVAGLEPEAAVLTYPNIEAPETIAAGQEIAVQVSLSDQQIAPGTHILIGDQQDGKLKLNMAAGEQQWILTVNVSAPGLELSRGTNTQQITVTRHGNSDVAAFYLRPKIGSHGEFPAMRDTLIFATLFHNGAFVARLSKPITITDGQKTADVSLAQRAVPSTPISTTVAMRSDTAARVLDLSAAAPTLTITENRVNNVLDINFNFSSEGTIEKNIDDASTLHMWINAHYAKMARYGRGFGPEHAETTLQSGNDYLNAFGRELYD
ncbi:MAG: hypothetical protein ACYCPS_05950, partial [Candidatus Saccharimonadales bacterium]